MKAVGGPASQKIGRERSWEGGERGLQQPACVPGRAKKIEAGSRTLAGRSLFGPSTGHKAARAISCAVDRSCPNRWMDAGLQKLRTFLARRRRKAARAAPRRPSPRQRSAGWGCCFRVPRGRRRARRSPPVRRQSKTASTTHQSLAKKPSTNEQWAQRPSHR